MARPRRILLNGFTTLLALLAAFLVVLWVRSGFVVYTVDHVAESGTVSTEANAGQLHITWYSDPAVQDGGWKYHSTGRRPSAKDQLLESLRDWPRIHRQASFAGFEFFSADGNPQGDFPLPALHVVGLPLWFLVLLTAVIPVWRGGRWFIPRPERQVSGRCAKCGYDLRASAERCPECGAPVDHDII